MAKEKKTENTSVPAEHLDAADRTVRSGIGSDDTAEPVAMSTFLKQNRLTKNEISTESVKSQADVLGALARCSIGGQRETHAENVLSSASTDKLSMSLVKDGATTNALNFPLFSVTGSISESSEEPWVQDLEEVPFGHDGHSVQKQVAVKEYDVEATFENNGRNNCMEVNAIDIVDDEISTSASRMKMSSSRVPVLRIERGDMRWLAHGYKEMSPLSNKVYFTSLEAMDRVVDRESISGFGLSGVASSKRVISVCIPCYNEDASALKRSLTSLAKQNLPADVTMEILVAMDGVVQLSDSMAAYLSELFGISFIVGHENNPFERLQTPNTVVVEPIFEDKNMFGANLALLIKRKNLRKVNSQEWWLRSHAPASLCEFAFATDCGITFDTNCLQLMLKRFDIDPNMSGLTGYQRVMSAKMQGDGRFEILTDPVGCFLRLLQSYDFEVSQSTTKSLLDSIGFIPVLPGPCSFFRTKHLQGVLDEYFSLTTETIKGGRGGIVLGNVQLAEDRFPPVLLTFRSKDSCKDAGLVRPKTGFEHDAVFYFEAEKPLRQLVTQRRRWINGAYTAVYWVLLDSWIRKADHSIFTKLGASLILFIEFAQGALVRTCVPATLACGLMYMCTIFPSVYANDAEKVRDILDGGTVEPSLVGIGAAAAFFYLSLFAVFIFSHTPRAIPVTDDNGEVHWRSDSSSAYRPRIFFLAFVVNAITIAVFVYVGVGVFMIVGWQGTPGYFQALCLLMALPYLVALMDGLINSERPNLRAVWNMLMLFPIFLISSVWFYVWLPCYASARISDLSWGNRDCSGQSCKSSDVAIYRAYLGRVVSISLVIINTLLTGSIIGVGNFVDGFLTIVLFSLLVLNMMLHLGNLLDMLVRLCFTRIPRWVCGEAPVYLKKQDNEVNKSAPASEISSHDDESGDGSIASESPTPIGPGRWRIDF